MMLYANDPTNPDGAKELLKDQKLAPLQAEYQAFFTAPVSALFDAVADHERFCQSTPNLLQIALCQSEQGLIRRCDFGNDMVVDQLIVLCQPPSLFAYAITTPNPLGVRQHCAIATCQAHENGSHLNWQHHFEHDDLTAMLAMLNTMFDHVITGLLEEFGGHKLS